MHSAMKYLILNTIENNQVIKHENETTGFTSYVVLDKNNKHLMTVHYNWKYQNYFVHTANNQTVTEGTIPQSRYAMISDHYYDLQDIVTACFRKVHNIQRVQKPKRRPVSEHLMHVVAKKMSDEERARFLLLRKSVHAK